MKYLRHLVPTTAAGPGAVRLALALLLSLPRSLAACGGSSVVAHPNIP